MRSFWALTISALMTIGSAAVADACANCKCGDPTLTLVGVEKPFAGRLRLSTDLSFRTEEHGDIRLGPRSSASDQRADLGLTFAPTQRLLLGATLPIVRRQLVQPNLAQEKVTGLANPELSAKAILWSDKPLRARHISGLTARLELPMSPERLDARGQGLSLDAQLDSGAWVSGLGLFYSFFRAPWSAHLSAEHRWSSVGWERHQPGASLSSSVSLQYQIATSLGVGLGIEGTLSARDEIEGAPVEGSSGAHLRTSPSLLWSPMTDVIVHTTLRVPVVNTSRDEETGVDLIAGVALDL